MAVQEGNSDVVEVRLAGSPQALEVLLNQKALSFTEQNWMDLKGEWPSPMQGLPMAVMLSLVLPQEVVDSGSNTKAKVARALEKSRCTWSQVGGSLPCL